MSAVCPRKHGAGRTCGTPLTFHTDRLGRLVSHCVLCARREAGICRRCPRPVDGQRGKALYCAPCRRRAHLEAGKVWRHRDLEHTREIRRETHRRMRDRRRGGPPGDPHAIAIQRGHARAAALTPERRREIARLAVQARWAKARERAA